MTSLKLGQVLCKRPDLVGKKLAEQLAQLRASIAAIMGIQITLAIRRSGAE